jgi:hypothetical protein
VLELSAPGSDERLLLGQREPLGMRRYIALPDP